MPSLQAIDRAPRYPHAWELSTKIGRTQIWRCARKCGWCGIVGASGYHFLGVEPRAGFREKYLCVSPLELPRSSMYTRQGPEPSCIPH